MATHSQDNEKVETNFGLDKRKTRKKMVNCFSFIKRTLQILTEMGAQGGCASNLFPKLVMSVVTFPNLKKKVLLCTKDKVYKCSRVLR